MTQLLFNAEQKDKEREAANADMMEAVNKANDHNARWSKVAQKAKRYASDLPNDLDTRILVMAEHMVDTAHDMREREAKA